jgi:hypothetical protein
MIDFSMTEDNHKSYILVVTTNLNTNLRKGINPSKPNKIVPKSL